MRKHHWFVSFTTTTMVAGNTWPYFIETGFAAVFFAFVVFVSYGARDDIRKWKFLLGTWVFGITATVAAAIAFGLTERTRSDGIEVVWGPAAMALATHGPIVACVMLSVSYEFIDAVIGFLLGTGSAAFVLFATLTPLQNGGNPRSAAIVFVVIALLCALAAGFLILVAALNWSRFVFFPLAYRLEEGRANVNNRWTNALLALGVAAGLCLYVIFYATGPAGWRQYSEWTQTWLWIMVADVIYVFGLMALTIYWFNPDGDSATATMAEVLHPANTVQTDSTSAQIGSSMQQPQQRLSQAESLRLRQAHLARLA